MNVIRSGYSGDLVVPIDSEFESKRVIFVNGEINQELADEFLKQVMHLVMLDSEAPIHVIINSCGGEIDAGLKMCDVVAQCPCQIHAYCFTKAYSMAAILFESVNGSRNMVGHSKLMLHQPSVMGIQRGSASEVEELSKQLIEKNDLLLSMVADRCRWSLGKLKEETVKDRYFDAKEALETGLADQALEFVDLMKLCILNK